MTTPNSLRETEMEARARRAVIDSGDWLTAAEILLLQGVRSRSDCAQPAQWKQQGDIFTIYDHGTEYFPVFGLEKEAGYRPYRVMSKIIDIFKDHKDRWGMAFWFQSVNSYLGGLRPQDLMATDPNLIINAALDVVLGIKHG